MRVIFLVLLALISAPIYADCGCSGNVYLRLVYQDATGNSHDARVLGDRWPVSAIKTTNPQALFENRLKAGASFNVVTAFTTLPINTKKHGVVRAPFVVRTGVKLDKKTVAIVKKVELLETGCAAHPSPVRSENIGVVSTTTPVKVEASSDKNYGGMTYRIFFKKKNRIIWLRYSPDRGSDCLKSSQSKMAIVTGKDVPNPDFPDADVQITCKLEQIPESGPEKLYVVEDGVIPKDYPAPDSEDSSNSLPVGHLLDLKGKKCGEWLLFSAYWAGDMVGGWVKQDYLSPKTPFEYLMSRYRTADKKNIVARRKWIENAAMLSPNDSELLKELEAFFAENGPKEKRGKVRLRLDELKIAEMSESGSPADNTDLAFGHRKNRGNIIESIKSISKPAEYTEAFCRGGDRIKIQYEKDIDRSNGKKSIFKIDTSAEGNWDVCMLVKPSFLKNRRLLSLSSGQHRECNSLVKNRLVHQHRRTVSNCWTTATGAKTNIVQVSYQTLWNSYLVSLVYMDGKRIVYYDDYAVPQESGSTCWRVEDLCEYNERANILTAAFLNGDSVEILYLNEGSHGVNAILLGSSGDKFRIVARGNLAGGAH